MSTVQGKAQIWRAIHVSLELSICLLWLWNWNVPKCVAAVLWDAKQKPSVPCQVIIVFMQTLANWIFPFRDNSHQIKTVILWKHTVCTQYTVHSIHSIQGFYWVYPCPSKGSIFGNTRAAYRQDRIGRTVMHVQYVTLKASFWLLTVYFVCTSRTDILFLRLTVSL